MSKFARYTPNGTRKAHLTAADGLIIRAARASDLGEVAGIAAERQGEPLDKWKAVFERYEREVRAGRAVVMVATNADRVIGYGKADPFAPPEGSPPNVVPAGWYLTGVVVRPEDRRRGVGRALTIARLDWIAERSAVAYYVANERNRVSIDLHRDLGFAELTRDFHHPQVRFSGGNGVLFVCDLSARPRRNPD